jgi:hypothetical protein
MADNTRQFTLIGNFTDHITKPLESVNKALDEVLKKLERYHTIGVTIKNDFKEVNASVRTLSSDFRDQARAVGEVSTQLKHYKTQLGGANRANRRGGLKFATTASRLSNNEGIAAAKAQGVIFITKDSDFIDLVDRLGTPPQIIWLTCGNTSNARLREILSANLLEALKILSSGEALVEIT